MVYAGEVASSNAWTFLKIFNFEGMLSKKCQLPQKPTVYVLLNKDKFKSLLVSEKCRWLSQKNIEEVSEVWKRQQGLLAAKQNGCVQRLLSFCLQSESGEIFPLSFLYNSTTPNKIASATFWTINVFSKSGNERTGCEVIPSLWFMNTFSISLVHSNLTCKDLVVWKEAWLLAKKWMKRR